MLYRNQDQKLTYATPTKQNQQVRFTMSTAPKAHDQILYDSAQRASYAPNMNRSVNYVGYYQ